MEFKKIIKFLSFGISWGCTWFVIVGVIGVLIDKEGYMQQLSDHFIKQAIASIIVGIGFGSSPIVYTFEKLSFTLQVFIHFAVGMGVFFPIAFYMGWVPMVSGLNLIVFIAAYILFFFIIWFGFFLYNKSESRRINKRIKEMEQEENNR